MNQIIYSGFPCVFLTVCGQVIFTVASKELKGWALSKTQVCQKMDSGHSRTQQLQSKLLDSPKCICMIHIPHSAFSSTSPWREGSSGSTWCLNSGHNFPKRMFYSSWDSMMLGEVFSWCQAQKGRKGACPWPP